MAHESKEEFEKRLKREGRWDQFRAVRKGLATGEGGIGYKRANEILRTDPRWGPDGNVESRKVDRSFELPNDRLPDGMPLLNPGIWHDRPQPSYAEEIEWVRRHLSVKGVVPEKAPSASAFTMLWRARASDSGYHEFITKLAAKLIPTRSELQKERDRSPEDDGGDLAILHKVQDCRLRAEENAARKRKERNLVREPDGTIRYTE